MDTPKRRKEIVQMGLKKYEKLRMEVKEKSRKLHRLGVNCIDRRMRKKLLSKTEFYKKRVDSNQRGGGVSGVGNI